MDTNDFRVTKLKEYIVNLINNILERENEVNIDRLSKDINNYSLDKIPTESVIETYITGDEIHRDVYSFRSRLEYSYDVINNLNNIGFFEQFEKQISLNNINDALPEINGIRSIECLNCGTLNNANERTAEFDIQIQITYEVSY